MRPDAFHPVILALAYGGVKRVRLNGWARSPFSPQCGEKEGGKCRANQSAKPYQSSVWRKRITATPIAARVKTPSASVSLVRSPKLEPFSMIERTMRR